MKSEVMFDFCFIRQNASEFAVDIQKELALLFNQKLHWYLDYKQKEGFEVVVAEVRGFGPWQTEEEASKYIEAKASSDFFQWLQGYRLQVFPKKESKCHACTAH